MPGFFLQKHVRNHVKNQTDTLSCKRPAEKISALLQDSDECGLEIQALISSADARPILYLLCHGTTF